MKWLQSDEKLNEKKRRVSAIPATAERIDNNMWAECDLMASTFDV